MSNATEPNIKALITIPALITLGITLLRLLGELGNLPSWLASREAGGGSALLGISWLPPILGVYFALKLAGAPGTFWKNLLKTLFYYGLAARIPVILVMAAAILGNWGTHYDAFPSPMAEMSAGMKILVGAVATQLFFWACVWTVGSGMITGMITSKLVSPKADAATA